MAYQSAGYVPNALRQYKRLRRKGKEQDLSTAILRGVDEFAAAFSTAEPARFMARFLKRKKPGH